MMPLLSTSAPFTLVFFGLICFLYGFFPPKVAVRHESTPPICDPVLPKPLVKNFVFVVIDGLRQDFVYHNEKHPMAFLETMHQSGEIPVTTFSCHVQHPTVTMPRLKAMLSGTVPSYLDIATNLASTKIAEDNWLSLAAHQGLRTVFFGDDTWLKLFPPESHVLKSESEGTVSFFVTDYTEVDDNVTRHLASWTQKRDEWDIMILHYLGLDHIGHSVGAKSALINEKLKEMDVIMSKLYAQLVG